MNKKKILYTANTYNHLYLCHLPYLKWLNENNFIVHTATRNNKKLPFINKIYSISVSRSPFRFGNLKAIWDLKKIIKKEKYDLIHTNTPMGAVVTRLAARSYRKKGKLKIIYTAHGFHFFKGCPIINYVLFYPIEKILSKCTDLIITMNMEDYEFAKKHFKTKIRYIPGIGFNKDKLGETLSLEEKKCLKKQLGINCNDYIITYVAEISKRKRQKYLIKALSKMDLKNITVLLIGDNNNGQMVTKLINKNNLEDKIKMIGFQDNINKYLEITDLVVSVSKQEGLPLNIMEAMYKEKPIIVSNCRGNRDLIINNKNGIVVSLNNQEELIKAILLLKNNNKLSDKLRKGSKDIDKYSIDNVLPIMIKIYKEMV